MQLLTIFAEHLAACGNQLALQQEKAEPAAVARARKIIDLQSQEEVSLGQVAKLVNVSANYFSELFRKTTGIRSVDYVAPMRVEKAKNLLLNPRARISEVAFDRRIQIALAVQPRLQEVRRRSAKETSRADESGSGEREFSYECGKANVGDGEDGGDAEGDGEGEGEGVCDAAGVGVGVGVGVGRMFVQ